MIHFLFVLPISTRDNISNAYNSKIINSARRLTSCLTSTTPIPITTDNRSGHKNRRPTLLPTGFRKKKHEATRPAARTSVNKPLMDRGAMQHRALPLTYNFHEGQTVFTDRHSS
ncbi:hypothetical protein O3G_MSEX008447 [Manduca sexta]|uniref:Uncharacterized protein n=1 Tax=Manduca sexta TaxID=7130 RepID=A0A921ZAL7_MANSE|nr:hypothetical protein O3G_MSEX008447 [Manduca sexta]